MWDDRHKINILWGTGMTDMTLDMLAKATVCDAALTQNARMEVKEETARHDNGGLEASQHTATTHDGEPQMRQLQQPPKQKPKLQPRWQPEPQHEPKAKQTPTLARSWETVQPQTQCQEEPTGRVPAAMAGSNIAE